MGDAITGFFKAWSEEDASAREAALDGAMAAPFRYCDPNTPHPIEDLGTLTDYIGAFTARMPGAQAQIVSRDLHHGAARALIDFTVDGRALMRGQYFALLDERGRIEHMAGFNGTGETT